MKRWVDPALRVLISLFHIWVMMAALSKILLSPVPFWQYAVPGAVMYLVIRLVTGSKPGRIVGIVLLVPAVIALLFLLLDKGEAHDAFVLQASALGQAFEKLYFFEPLVGTRYEVWLLPILWMLTAVTVIWVWLFLEHRFRFLLVVGYGMACILLAYEMASVNAVVPFLLFTVLSICTWAGSVYDRRRRGHVEHSDAGVGRIMLQALPIALLTLLISLPFQKPEAPMRWKWLENKINDMYTRIEEKFTHTDTEYFSLTATGFSGREHLLGGRVRQSNTFVMEVEASMRAYLRGASYQNYTGTSWMTADPGFDYGSNGYPESAQDLAEVAGLFSLLPSDFLFPREDASTWITSGAQPTGTQPPLPDETRALLDRFADGQLTDLLFPKESMRITYRNMTTRTLFAPLKTQLPVNHPEGNVIPVTQNSRAVFLAPAFMGSGSQYVLTYRQPMYGDQILVRLLSLAHEGLYEEATAAYVGTWNSMVAQAVEGGLSPMDMATYADAATLMDRLVAANEYGVYRGDTGAQTPEDTEGASAAQDARRLEEISAILSTNRNPFETPVYQKLSEMESRAADTYRKYTTLPLTVTDRTRAFAQDVTEGLTTDYDKVIAIRDALRTLYPYSLVMPRLPEGEDFTDWFLFEQQSGYCTAYATAMTVLLRTLDIPARYVEGYVLPEKEEDEEFYRVTNRFAHAWTEVYFEGFGWLSFEPTPGFAGTTDFLAQNAADLAGYEGSPYLADLEELMRMYGQNRDLEDDFSYVGPLAPTREPLPPRTVALLIFGGLLGALLLTDLGSRLVEAIRFGRTPPRRQVVYRYLRMLDWLKLAGVSLEPGETLPEFAARVDTDYYFPETSFRHLSDLFSRVRYGAADPTSAELRLLRDMAGELKGQIVREIGLRRLLPLRHVLLRI